MPIFIINGGDPMDDCPDSYEDANAWARAHNRDEGPQWSWDCGFKLDYDGPILRFSSRFYPPKTHYGPNWDGDVDVILLGRTIHTEKFNCSTLEKLRDEVEKFAAGYVSKLHN